MKFTRPNAALVSGIALLLLVAYVVPLRTIGGDTPQYDLLFSVDRNDTPYTDPSSQGIVIHGKDGKASVIFTGNWSDQDIDWPPTKPSVFICEPATGSVREIPIPFDVPSTSVRHIPPTPHPVQTIIRIPELESLTIDSSGIAPDGYAIHGRNVLYGSANERMEIRFDRTYAFGELVENTFAAVILGGGEKYRSAVQLEPSTYKHCLQQVGGSHDTGLDAHFIGWIIPARGPSP
jgi:hypothetical protein